MTSINALTIITLGAILGAFATVFHVLKAREDMTDGQVWVLLLGGAFGGAMCAVAIDLPFMKRDIVLIGLCGYFASDLIMHIVKKGTN